MTKSIVVTGASKGIGRAAADALVADGWSVIGVARTATPDFQESSWKPISRTEPKRRSSPISWSLTAKYCQMLFVDGGASLGSL